MEHQNKLFLIVSFISLLLLTLLFYIVYSNNTKPVQKKKVVVVEDVHVWDRWPDWGYGSWRRGGRPWGKRNRRRRRLIQKHTLRKSGGAKRGRP